MGGPGLRAAVVSLAASAVLAARLPPGESEAELAADRPRAERFAQPGSEDFSRGRISRAAGRRHANVAETALGGGTNGGGTNKSHAPPVHSPSVHSPPVHSPSVLSPSAHSPPVHSPSVLSPSVLSPSVLSPSVLLLRSPPPSPPPVVDTINVTTPAGQGTGYQNYIYPNPPSPPPSPPPAPPAPPPIIIGADVGVPVALTGDAHVDAHNEALVDALRMIENLMIPIVFSIIAFVLFVIHSLAVSSPGFIAFFSAEQRHMIDVLCTGTCFVLCGFAFIVFNKLVLLSVPLPCLIAAIQMGATCFILLLVNGAVSAIFHSRTKRVLTAASIEVMAFFTSCCACCKSPDAADDDVNELTEEKQTRRVICNPAASCGLAFCGARRWVGIKIGTRQDVWRWMPAAVLYAGAHLFLVMALRDVTVTALIIWRQLAPLPTMIVESFLTNAIYRATCSSTFGLLCIAVGVLVYSAADLEFSWIGSLFTILSTFMMVWEGLLKRHLLTDTKQPLVLSLQAMVLLNNAVGCALALLLVLSYEIWIFGYQQLPTVGIDEITYLVASVFLSASYHYMGLQLAKAVSATSLLAATNFYKILIVIFGAAFLGDTSTPAAWAGAVFALLGNVIYMLARLHVMQQQALRRETVTQDGAKDIVDNIMEPRQPRKGEEPDTSGQYGASAGSAIAEASAKVAAWVRNPKWETLRPSFYGDAAAGELLPPMPGVPTGAPPSSGGVAEASRTRPPLGAGCLPLDSSPEVKEEAPEALDSDGTEQPRERLSALRQRVMGPETDLDADEPPRPPAYGKAATTADRC